MWSLLKYQAASQKTKADMSHKFQYPSEKDHKMLIALSKMLIHTTDSSLYFFYKWLECKALLWLYLAVCIVSEWTCSISGLPHPRQKNEPWGKTRVSVENSIQYNATHVCHIQVSEIQHPWQVKSQVTWLVRWRTDEVAARWSSHWPSALT